MKKLFVCITIISFYTSPVLAGADLNAATNDACKCLEKPYKVAEDAIKKIQQAQTSGDTSNIAESQNELMSVINSATKCFEKLPEKYPEIDKSKELQNKLMTMVEKKCPNPATAMMKTQ